MSGYFTLILGDLRVSIHNVQNGSSSEFFLQVEGICENVENED